MWCESPGSHTRTASWAQSSVALGEGLGVSGAMVGGGVLLPDPWPPPFLRGLEAARPLGRPGESPNIYLRCPGSPQCQERPSGLLVLV